MDLCVAANLHLHMSYQAHIIIYIDCRQCKSCPLHIDSKDKGLTILHLYQSSRTPVKDRVYFVLGSVAHTIAGGMSFIFDGKTVRHGVWAPDSCGYDCTGLALVTR